MSNEGILWLLVDAAKARKQGERAIVRRQRDRLADLVAIARTGSPYYRELYRNLPSRVDDVTLLPVTNKTSLMDRFDEWSTDRDVTLQRVRACVDQPELIGDRFLGKYTVATTSGTSGTRGIFLLDDRSMAVTGVLALRMLRSWLTAGDIVRIIAGGGRLAMVNAMGGHFASAVAATRLRRRGGKRIQVFPVSMPLPDMVAGLNAFRPTVLAPYASLGALLANEQEAGRLSTNPVLVVLSAEGLPDAEYERIGKAFHARVRHGYAATECPFLSYSCEYGWLHVNADWVIFEPVDASYRPVDPGESSHTVLISNLANRTQPILRYDLGDSILQRSDPCPCGNPLPAVRVQGRAADVLIFPTGDGRRIAVPPLTLSTVMDHIPDIALSQIVQATPTRLDIRLRLADGAERDRTWQTVHAALTKLLAEHELGHVTINYAAEPPVMTPGGKYRSVVPMN